MNGIRVIFVGDHDTAVRGLIHHQQELLQQQQQQQAHLPPHPYPRQAQPETKRRKVTPASSILRPFQLPPEHMSVGLFADSLALGPSDGSGPSSSSTLQGNNAYQIISSTSIDSGGNASLDNRRADLSHNRSSSSSQYSLYTHSALSRPQDAAQASVDEMLRDIDCSSTDDIDADSSAQTDHFGMAMI